MYLYRLLRSDLVNLEVVNDFTNCLFDVVDANGKWDFVLSDFSLVFRRQLIKSNLLVDAGLVILSHCLNQ